MVMIIDDQSESWIVKFQRIRVGLEALLDQYGSIIGLKRIISQNSETNGPAVQNTWDGGTRYNWNEKK